jgi:hypothetical protein
MLLKFITTQFHTLRNKSSRYIHVKGCPTSVAQHVNYLAAMAKINNPNFDPRLIVQVNTSYYQMQLKSDAIKTYCKSAFQLKSSILRASEGTYITTRKSYLILPVDDTVRVS